MKLLELITNFFAPEMPVMDPALLAREAEAERIAANGFRVLQDTRKEYDKRKPSRGGDGLSTIKRRLVESDRLMIEAFKVDDRAAK